MIPGTEVQQPAVDGGTLQLTINRDLQWYLQQLIGEQVQDMAAQRGTIIVVEVETGKIRAAAEYPIGRPERSSTRPTTEDRSSRIFTRPVRARIDVQGADRGDRARRRRPDPAVDRRRVRARRRSRTARA